MELVNILNANVTPAKPVTGALMQYDMQHLTHELQHPQPQYQPQHAYAAHLSGRIKSETGSERGVSPHPSDMSSRYSSTPAQSIAGYPSLQQQYGMDQRYPSPSTMNVNNPMMGYNGTTQPPELAYPGAQAPIPKPGSEASPGTGPPKAFPCSTCGKGFARRSDLARHGTWKSLPWSLHHSRADICHRAHSQWRPTTRMRASWMRQTVHPTLRSHGPPASPHRREASHVRALRQGEHPKSRFDSSCETNK